MARRRDDHWLSGVERVLRADTGDLRDLARTGGADPRTLYVGTSMQGADLRGLDLRGMKFSDLDLRKVRHDETTLLDEAIGDPTDPEDLSGVMALIYFNEERLLEDFNRGMARQMPWARAYGRRDAQRFIEAGRRIKGPKVVAADLRIDQGFANVAPIFALDDVVIVTTATVPGGRPKPRDLAVFEGMGAPVIFTAAVQSPSGGALGHSPRIGPGFREVMRLLAADWRSVLSAANRFGFSLLLRAKGLGRDRASDAWAHIFGRTVTLDLLGARMQGFVRRKAQIEPLPGILFRQMDATMLLPDDYAGDFDVALLADLTGPGIKRTESRYDRVITDVMKHLNWDISRPESARRSEIDFIVRSPGESTTLIQLKAEVGKQSSLEYQQLVLLPRADLTHQVVISEAAQLPLIISGLEEGKLWVNTRDLLVFPTEGPTPWLLVAAQLRRIRSQSTAKQRTRYLAYILRAALDVGETDTVPFEWRQALSDDHFADYFTLRLMQVDEGHAWLDCGIDLYVSKDSRPQASIALHIDAQGPQVRGAIARPQPAA